MNRRKIKSAARVIMAGLLVCYGAFFALSSLSAEMTSTAIGLAVVGLVATAATDLRKERAKAAERMNELVGLIDKPQDDRPGKISNQQIDEEYTQLEAKIEELDKQIEEADKWGRRKAVSSERNKRLSQSQGFPVPVDGIGTPRQDGNRVEQIEVGPPNFVKDPKKGFETHRDFLSAVIRAGMGYDVDERLRHLTAGGDEQSSVADPYGGFLLPVGFAPNVLSVMNEVDPIADLVTRIEMTNPVVPINARVDKNHTSSVSGGFVVYRRAETQSVTASRQQYEQVTLNAHSLFGVAHASEELLARSPISFVALIEAGFRDEFAAKLIDERLNGTGVGMFEGIINSPATISVAKETGQAAATITKENIDKMRARCWGYGRSIWLYNHDCHAQLRSLVQAVGTGGAPVAYFSTTPDGQSTLDGRPAFATEFCQTLGTVGDIVLCNWSQYLEGLLTPLQSAESIHVRFENHERTFKFWLENDGRCWWRSALTPKRSSSTLSPFVTLATRS